MAFGFSLISAPAKVLPAAMFAACMGLMMLAAPAAANPLNLVQNGTFTDTTLTGAGGYLCNNTGGTSCTSRVANWSGTCATLGCVGTSTPSSLLFTGTNGSAWNGNRGLSWSGIGDPPLGGNTLAVDGDPRYLSILTQSISGLQLGHSYTLQFYQAASQQLGLNGATTERWSVSLGSGVAQSSILMNTPSQGAHGWMQQTMTFVADAATETLQFLAIGTPGGEPPTCLLGDVSLLDNISVPEPATIALVAAGLLGLVMVRRKASARG